MVGDDMALNLYRGFLLTMLSTLQEGKFPFYLCFYPENSLNDLKEWLGGNYRYLSQRGKDLGERMRNGFAQAFAKGFKRVVLIGSDIPDLPLAFIEEAFTSLEEKDAVIGPAYDGGYYLIGFKNGTFVPQVLEGIPWGTESVFEDTMKILKQKKKKVHILQRWRDIDTIEDLRDFIAKKPSSYKSD